MAVTHGLSKFDQSDTDPSAFGARPSITGTDHAMSHPQFSRDTLVHTLRYLTGSYFGAQSLAYCECFLIA